MRKRISTSIYGFLKIFEAVKTAVNFQILMFSLIEYYFLLLFIDGYYRLLAQELKVLNYKMTCFLALYD